MKTINKQSHIPYKYQLADILREIIHENATAFLPAENDLVQTFHGSRAKIRQALGALTREVWFTRSRGKALKRTDTHVYRQPEF